MMDKEYNRIVAELILSIDYALKKAESVIEYCKKNGQGKTENLCDMRFALSCMKSAMMVVENHVERSGEW